VKKRDDEIQILLYTNHGGGKFGRVCDGSRGSAGGVSEGEELLVSAARRSPTMGTPLPNHTKDQV
jgi:hypothetical protein